MNRMRTFQLFILLWLCIAVPLQGLAGTLPRACCNNGGGMNTDTPTAPGNHITATMTATVAKLAASQPCHQAMSDNSTVDNSATEADALSADDAPLPTSTHAHAPAQGHCATAQLCICPVLTSPALHISLTDTRIPHAVTAVSALAHEGALGEIWRPPAL